MPLLLAAGLVLAGKVFLIVSFGDMRLGDNDLLMRYADAILAGTDWLATADADRLAIPPTLWKPVGYPLFIAASRLVAGDAWYWLVLAGQSAMTFVAGLAIYRLGRTLGLGAVTAAAVFVLYEWSLPFSTDALLMPDALYGGLATFLLATMLARWREGRPLGIAGAAAYGVGFAACFLIREVFQYLVPFIAALVLVLALRDAPWPKSLAVALVFLVPPVIAFGGLKAWNFARTGQAVVTTGAQTALLLSLVEVAKLDRRVLLGDGPLETVAREQLKRFDYGEVPPINRRLFAEYGLTGPEQSALVWEKYLRTIRDYPLAFLRAVAARVNFVQQGVLLTGPLVRYDDMLWWRGGATAAAYYTGWRGEVRRFRETYDPGVLSANAVVQMLPRLAVRVIGPVLLLGYLVLAPLLALRVRAEDPDLAVIVGGTWLLYLAVVGVHLLVNLEMRYLSGVVGFAILGLFVVVKHFAVPVRAHLRRRKASRQRAMG